MAVEKVYQEIYETLIKVKGQKEAQKQLEELEKQAEKTKKSLIDWDKVSQYDMGEHIGGPEIEKPTSSEMVFGESIREASETIHDLTEDYDFFASRIQESAMNIDVLRSIVKSIEHSLQMIDESTANTDTEQEQLNALFMQYSDLLKDAYATLGSAEARMAQLATSTQEATDAIAGIASVSPFSRITASLSALTPKITQMGENARKSSGSAISQFKRFGFAILGVRSAFSLFRKAMSSAMASNAELGQKFNAIWDGIGNAIAPILERIINLILKAFSYLNLFVKAVSGGKIDLLANTSKSASSTAGSLKEANKYLAGFDELNNVDEQTGGSGGAGGGFTDPFKDIDVDTKWADRIQAFGEWVQINWPLVVGALAGTHLALSPITEGFTIWEKLGIVLIIAGIAEGFKGIYDFVNGIKTGNLTLISQGLREIALGIGLVSTGLLLLTQGMTGWYGIAIAIVLAFASYVVEHWEEIKEGWNILKENVLAGVQQLKEWFVEKWNNIKYAVTECWNGIVNNWNAMKQKLTDGVTAVKEWFAEKWNNISTAWNEIVKSMKDQWDGFKEKISQGAEKIKEFFGGIWQGAKDMANNVIGYIEGMINKAVNGINSLIRSINRISFTTPDWIPIIGGKHFGFNIGQLNTVTLPRLDSGTNYVPNDQLAMIHKGEAVIPKKFNSQEYFGGYSEMIEKLDAVIEAINNIEQHPYISVKDVGEASVKYQNQQYRLRGRSLVNG